jgi:hypothetical protein
MTINHTDALMAINQTDALMTGPIKLGNDKGEWIVIDAKNKIKQWYKLKGRVKNYITHDSGP